MEQVMTQVVSGTTRPSMSVIAALGVVLLMQGVVMFGPSFAGAWAHDGLHSYRHSLGMACH